VTGNKEKNMQKIIEKTSRWTIAVLTAMTLLGVGGLSMSMTGCKSKPAETTEADETPENMQVYSCPMHPEVRQSEPGKCPQCGMALELEEHSH
jgi:flagellar basal body-associated protein FliL